MSNIDRTQKEKVINIFGRKVKYGTICVIGLLIILSFSSLAYLESYLNTRANQPKETETEQKIQVALIIIFDENTTARKLLDIEPNANALFAFGKIANITAEDTAGGKIPSSVSAGNNTLANNQTHAWLFYANGRINLRGLEQYTVKNGDTLVLQFSQRLS